MVFACAEQNPARASVQSGDALVTEDGRLQDRINHLIDRIEASLKQAFRIAVAQGRLPQETDVAARAGIVLAYVLGRWLRYAKSGFRRTPGELFEQQALFLIA